MLPIMTEALSGLTQQVQFARIKRILKGFNSVPTIQKVNTFAGSLQPIHPRRLMIKPEGERQWRWFQLWTGQQLSTGDYVQDPNGVQYKVMASSDWSQAGYFEYELIESSPAGQVAP